MNGVHPSHDLLQRHHDGDLIGDQTAAAELRSHLDACEKCQAELASLGRLGQLLRRSAAEDLLGYGQDAQEPDFTRMFAEIQKAVATPEAATPNLPFPARPANKHAPRWLYRVAPAVGTMALAAAALLMVYRSDTVSPGNQGELQDQQHEVVAAVNRSEIVKVEFGSNAGTVFDIPLSDGSAIPVVWIDDDDDDEEE
jgi:anti-sigma factor RsiW